MVGGPHPDGDLPSLSAIPILRKGDTLVGNLSGDRDDPQSEGQGSSPVSSSVPPSPHSPTLSPEPVDLSKIGLCENHHSQAQGLHIFTYLARGPEPLLRTLAQKPPLPKWLS